MIVSAKQVKIINTKISGLSTIAPLQCFLGLTGVHHYIVRHLTVPSGVLCVLEERGDLESLAAAPCGCVGVGVCVGGGGGGGR